MADHSMMKLGRQKVRLDKRTLQLACYMTPALPAAPVSRDWTKGVTAWGMMLNDQLGCCTIAGVGHAVQVFSVNTGSMVTVPDNTILSYYEQWDGYDPNDAADTDNGGVELDVLKRWKSQTFAGNRLLGFADANVVNLDEIRQAINLYGGVYIGVNLPLTAQKQDVWDVVPNGGADAQSGSWGGHCVFVAAYDETGFTCITWGQMKRMTVAFWQKYVDEAHALLDANWINCQKSPAGFNQAQLMADLSAIQ
ncbi:hypothetical protein ACOBR2_06615 [Telmatobacter bradus]|uniref:hypothetical protein n=1 Tax=Telmatobacter bradus TaxID=474953 RepID=UPI003B432C67